MTRRQRGSGTVEQVGTMFRFRSPDGAGGRYTSPAEYPTEPEARRGLAIYRQKIVDGQLTPARGITLAQYVLNAWLPRVERETPRSAKTYRSNWNSQISKARFARLPIASIRRRDVRAWVTEMDISRPQSPLSVLRTILAAAIDDELIASNPAASLRLKRHRREETCPTPEEQRAILGCEHIPQVERLIVAQALRTGLRPGEWRTIRLADVHAETGNTDPHLWICRGSERGPTKSGKPRKVPLFGMALEAVRRMIELLPSYAPRNPLGLLFPHRDGSMRDASRPFGQAGGRNLWHVYREAAGLTRPVRLHDFRHAAATDLLTGEDGRLWSYPEIKELFGHSSVMTTEGFYAHRTASLLGRAAREQRSVQNSPEAIAEGLKNASIPHSLQLFHSSSASASNQAESAALPEIASGWTDSGLISELRAALTRAHTGRLTQEVAIALGARIVEVRRNADAVERAVVRLDSRFWRAAFVELTDILLPDSSSHQSRRSPASRKGAAR